MNLRKKLPGLILLLAFPFIASGQEQTAYVGMKVQQVTVRDSSNEPIELPYFGEKHLLIFYPDPDHAFQNKKFTDHLEDNHIISDNIHGFGIANLKDAPLFPNGMLRSIIRQKERRNNIKIYTDPSHILRDAWGLGDCNNKFVFLFITKDREIAYFEKGVLSEEQIARFYEVIEKYL